MAGFGKRGITQARNASAVSAAPSRKIDPNARKPAPRIQTGNTLHWGAVMPFTRARAMDVPETSGVYALMNGKREGDMVFLGGAKNLREEFLKEIATQAALANPRARFFCCAETPTPYEQADKEIQIFRRRFGRKPLLNSGF